MLAEPSLSVKHLESSHILKHLERFFHSEVLHLLGHVLEMIIIWIKFWVFPAVSISWVSGSMRSVWSSFVGISLSVVCCSFVWIREDCIGLGELSKLLFGCFSLIWIFVLSEKDDYGMVAKCELLVCFFDFFLWAILRESKNLVILFSYRRIVNDNNKL